MWPQTQNNLIPNNYISIFIIVLLRFSSCMYKSRVQSWSGNKSGDQHFSQNLQHLIQWDFKLYNQSSWFELWFGHHNSFHHTSLFSSSTVSSVPNPLPPTVAKRQKKPVLLLLSVLTVAISEHTCFLSAPTLRVPLQISINIQGKMDPVCFFQKHTFYSDTTKSGKGKGW